MKPSARSFPLAPCRLPSPHTESAPAGGMERRGGRRRTACPCRGDQHRCLAHDLAAQAARCFGWDLGPNRGLSGVLIAPPTPMTLTRRRRRCQRRGPQCNRSDWKPPLLTSYAAKLARLNLPAPADQLAWRIGVAGAPISMVSQEPRYQRRQMNLCFFAFAKGIPKMPEAAEGAGNRPSGRVQRDRGAGSLRPAVAGQSLRRSCLGSHRAV